MKKQELIKLRRLSESIGDFIRYWGFRKIHGEIWALVYLSKDPLSGIEIGQILKVSKALISPALKQLESEGLIVQTKSENSKTKRYTAQEDVNEIIQGVLRRRELPMIERIQRLYQELESGLSNEANSKAEAPEESSKSSDSINPDRMEKMGVMIQMAQLGLFTLLNSKQVWGE